MSEDLVADYALATGVSKDEARVQLMKQFNSDDQAMTLPASMMPAIELAVVSHDQVRTVAGFGGVSIIGFDQQAVHATAQMHQITLDKRAAGDLRVLQAEGLRLMRAQS